MLHRRQDQRDDLEIEFAQPGQILRGAGPTIRVVFSPVVPSRISPLLAGLGTTNGPPPCDKSALKSGQVSHNSGKMTSQRTGHRPAGPDGQRHRNFRNDHGHKPTARSKRKSRTSGSGAGRPIQNIKIQQKKSGIKPGALEKSNNNNCQRTSVFVSENFTVSYNQWFIFNRLVTDASACGLIHTTFRTLRAADHMCLSLDALRLLTVPNAGGSSVISEVLSYELLHRCFGASLLKTEMEVSYFPRGGSITDYVCGLAGVKMGVSVTRAMKFHGNLTEADARKLLNKKLSGIVQSSRNTLEKWNKQILHVWTRSRTDAEHVTQAFDTIDEATKSNTLVLVTIATDCDAIFANK